MEQERNTGEIQNGVDTALMAVELEWSIHVCPPRFQRELFHVFPDLSNHLNEAKVGSTEAISTTRTVVSEVSMTTSVAVSAAISAASEERIGFEFCAIPTFQSSSVDLVGLGASVEDAKDDLLERFVVFAWHVCDGLRKRGFWADFTDPASGYPVRSVCLMVVVCLNIEFSYMWC
jgi:hypothetical protein